MRRRWLLGLLVLQSASSAVLDMYQVVHPAAACFTFAVMTRSFRSDAPGLQASS